jgi:hypothetical protein
VRLGLARGFGLAEADGEGACVEGSGAADGDGVSALEAIGACAHPPSTISPDINDVEMIRSAARLRSRIVVERYPIIVASRTARPRAGTNSGPVSDAHDLALQAHDMGGRGLRLVACVVVTLMLAGCSGGSPTSEPLGTPGSTTASASAPGQTAATSPAAGSPTSSSSPIIGEWVRTASCDEALAAFVQAGLTDQVPDWVIGNYVGEGASAAPGKECANAKAAVPHSHFFTAEGRFGSRDENGQDVDDGDYQVVDADTMSFPSAARDFGYSGDVLVDYAVSGNEVTFSVNVPTPCEAECRVAYGWALSAFFGPRPFERK